MNWCKARELTQSDDLKTAAYLAYLASSPFYQLFTKDTKELVEALIPQFSLEQSELYDSWILKDGKQILGSYSAFNAEELNERQTTSFKSLLEFFPLSTALLENLRHYKDSVAPIPSAGFYLARITTEQSRVSKGVGSLLLTHFETSAGKNSPLLLHVASNNHAAIRFYEKRGYQQLSGSETYQISAYTKNI